MMIRRIATVCVALLMVVSIVGCVTTGNDTSTFAVPDDAKVKPQSVANGFATFEHEGSTWVFSTASEEVHKFMAGEELAKHVTKMKATSAGIMKLKAPDTETINGYLAAQPRYVTRTIDGYLWVFIEGSDELKTVDGGGELAKHVTRLANVNGKVQTIKAPDTATLKGYLASGGSMGTSGSTAPAPKTTAGGNNNLAIASQLARDAQSGTAPSKTGTHTNVKANTTTASQTNTTQVAAPAKTVTPSAVRSGFVIFEEEAATWVFASNSKELVAHQAGKELAKHSTKLKAAPGGIIKIKAPDQGTIDAYLAAKSGFVTRVIDGYLWVFVEGSAEQKAVDAGNELAKHVTKLTNVGGTVRTIKAPSIEVLNAYNAATPGIAARIVDGYLWVFAPKSETLALVDAGSEPAKHVTKLLNVNGQVRTVRAGDMSVINAYHASKPGFETMVVDGYTWIFKQGAPEFNTVLNGGELAKHVTKMSAVNGSVQTFKAPDADTLAAYMR